MNVLQLTVWQIVYVLPQTQEVRVSQCSLGADSAPGVKLQAESKHRGLKRLWAQLGSPGFCVLPAAARTAGRSPPRPT